MKYAHLGRTRAQLLRQGLRRLREPGLREAIPAALRALAAVARRPIVAVRRRVEWEVLRRRPERTFLFRGDVYRYFHHPYNATWRNERAVEVPIVLRAIEEAGAAEMLEFGNVLGHYVPRGHEVVDKYEPGGGVLNVDILDFRPAHSYRLIVSISTLEHVGWDDDERDPGKIPRAVGHIRSLLAPGGRAIVTVPLGYNPHVDEMLESGTLGFDEERCLLRTARGEWREVDKSALGRPAYGKPFPGANGLVIGIVEVKV